MNRMVIATDRRSYVVRIDWLYHLLKSFLGPFAAKKKAAEVKALQGVDVSDPQLHPCGAQTTIGVT